MAAFFDSLLNMILPAEGFLKADSLLRISYPIVLNLENAGCFANRLMHEYPMFKMKCLADAAYEREPDKLFDTYEEYKDHLEVCSVTAPGRYNLNPCDVLFIHSGKNLKVYGKYMRNIPCRFVVFICPSFHEILFGYMLSCRYELSREDLADADKLELIYNKLKVEVYMNEYYYVLNDLQNELNLLETV